MKKTEEIEVNMFLAEERQKAKKIPRSDLEDMWVQVKQSEAEDVGLGWKITTVLAVIIAVFAILIIFSNATSYAGSETENYRSFGEEICYEQELGGYRFVQIDSNTITIRCDYSTYKIGKV